MRSERIGHCSLGSLRIVDEPDARRRPRESCCNTVKWPSAIGSSRENLQRQVEAATAYQLEDSFLRVILPAAEALGPVENEEDR
jgi:hypothetical protein